MSGNVSKTQESTKSEVLFDTKVAGISAETFNCSKLEEQNHKHDINDESKLPKPKKKKFVLKRKKQKNSLRNDSSAKCESDSRASSKSSSITNAVSDIAAEVTPIPIHLLDIGDYGTNVIETTSTNTIVDKVIDNDYRGDCAKIANKTTPYSEEKHVDSSSSKATVSEESIGNSLVINEYLQNRPEHADNISPNLNADSSVDYVKGERSIHAELQSTENDPLSFSQSDDMSMTTKKKKFVLRRSIRRKSKGKETQMEIVASKDDLTNITSTEIETVNTTINENLTNED